MKKLLINLFLILGVLAIAQNKRFIYEYKFISDSTNVDDVKTEMMFLDTTKDGSKYYSYTVFNSDSIMKVDLEKQLAATGSINVKADLRKGDVRYSVTKTYPDYKINLHRRLGMDAYNISDDRKINWKILSEKEKIGEWNAQKAEADFAGRKWIAWFSTEIPIQDGPYKFHGLPGLIVKIEDEAKYHSFELKGISKYVENNKLQIDDERNYEKEILIDHLKYKKLAAQLRNDPTKSLREMMNSASTSFKIIGPDGNEIKPSDLIRQRELKAKEDRKKNNNPLELDLLK